MTKQEIESEIIELKEDIEMYEGRIYTFQCEISDLNELILSKEDRKNILFKNLKTGLYDDIDKIDILDGQVLMVI